MWSDNETEIDFLNFSGVAATVAELIDQAEGQPVSIGVSGKWGVGKSSMIKLIRRSLSEMEEEREDEKIVFVEFNAWLYQGYDDARAALMDVIATKLKSEAEKRKTGVDKAQEFLQRVDWLRTAKLAVSTAGFFAGVPPVALIAEAVQFGRQVKEGKADAATVKKAGSAAEKTGTAVKGLVKPRQDSSPPEAIHALRECFEETLEEMGITLVVLIDDLDRCLPETTISTLEAIKLFLFLKNTAFVIAADDAMIKHAVKHHFEGVDDDDLVTSYLDKLIQVPIRVPPLGIQEVRAYMALLFVKNSGLSPDAKERIRSSVCEQLGQTWQGKRVDRAFIESLGEKLTPELTARLDAADRLAPLMTRASGIKGNPRLIKRFLNALSIRMSIAKAQGIRIDEAALAKMLLFERCGKPDAYTELATAVMESGDGKPTLIADWEDQAQKGQEVELSGHWDNLFIKEWLALPPFLADRDLRGILYVSREHAPLISVEDRLSSEGAELLGALLHKPDMAREIIDRLKQLSPVETAIIMDRLLDKARQEQEWGNPPILEACIAMAEADPAQGSRLASLLIELLPGQIKPSIVPKISDQAWSKEVFEAWKQSGVSQPVKKAIETQGK